MAKYFGNEGIISRTEEVIEEELESIKDTLDTYKNMRWQNRISLL